MMDRQAPVDRIIESIYDSAVDSGAQRRLVADIGALLGSHCANLRIVRRNQPIIGIWRGFPDFPDQFFAAGVAQNEWRRGLLETKGELEVGVHFGSEGIARSELVKTRFYDEFCKPFGIDYSVAAYFQSERGNVGVLGVYRSYRRGDYGPHEGLLLDKLLPHLARAAAFADRLRQAELLRSSGERAWDLMPWGVLLLGSGGQILFANRGVEEILKDNDGLTIRHGRLVATAGADSARLETLLTRASKPKNGPRTGGAMSLRRPGKARPLQLSAMPLPREAPAFPLFEPIASTCVLLFDPDRQVVPVTEGLKVIYGLTRAEAALVTGLLRGERLDHYAERAGITLNTVRTHLKSVFAKTDTHRQAELMRLVAASLPVPLEPEP
jgi:DNA-binding CsgD family transcriptional regulator